jgi:hypothetical protein
VLAFGGTLRWHASRRIGLAIADPAQRASMVEVRDALHEMYSAEVRRIA